MIKKLHLFLTLLTAFLWLGTGTMWGDELIVANGTGTSQYYPLYGAYCDWYVRSQMIYPATMLSSLEGKKIDGMTFHIKTVASDAWTSNFQVRVATVAAGTDYSSSTAWNTTEGTLVYEGTLSGTQSTMAITFSSSFTYEGGALLVEIKNTTTGNYPAPYFYGASQSNYSAVYGRNSSSMTFNPSSRTKFLPKVTIVYSDAGPVTCPKPSDLTQGTVTHNSADFTWTAGGEEASWQYVYLPAATTLTDEAWNGATAGTVNSAAVSLSGLSAGTDYKLYVRAYCSASEQSANISKQFRTNNVIPFSEDFTGLTSGIPAAWDNSEGTTSSETYKWNYNNSGHDAAPCVRFNSSTNGSGNTNILKTPAIYVDKAASLSFWYKNPTGGDFSVYYSIDGVKQLDALATGLTGAADWTNREVNLPAACVGHNVMILFQATSNYGSSTAYIYLDDVLVEVASSCAKPTELSVNATSATTAHVAWTAGGEETAWNLQFSTDNFSTYSERTGITENPYTLTGLSEQTTYKVRIQADCGGAQSGWVVSSAFATPCAAVDGIGFSQNFDSESHSAGSIPGCWQKINSGNYPYVYNYYAKGCSGKCLYFYGGVTGSSEQIAILPPFNEATNTLFVTLYYSNSTEECGGWNNYSTASYGQLEIGYITNPADASTFTAQETLPRVSTYSKAQVALTNAPAGSRVALRYLGGSSAGAVYVDDIAISAIPSCLAPSSVSGAAITYDEASISWTANGSESAWKVRYSSDNGANWSEAISASTNPFTLTGLSAKTTYIAQVKAVCGGEEESDWSASSEPFYTPCLPQAASYSFGFETAEGAVNGEFPTSECWKRITTSSYPVVYNYYAKSGSQCLRFYGSGTQYAILPQFNEDVKGLALSFYYYNDSWGGALSVGYMTDPEDASTFVLVQDLASITAYAGAATEINLSAAAAGARYIAFKYVGGESYHASYLDDVVVEKALSCQKPTDVVVSNVTATTADVAWTENNSATTWKLQISNNGSAWTDVNGGADITSNPYTLTGLTPNHATYYVRVKSVCGGSDASNWSNASDPFETDCAAAALPFTENFGGADLGCWTKNNCYSSTGLYSGAFRFYYNYASSEIPPQYLISPELDVEGKQVTVEFDYRAESPSWPETFKVGYSTTTSDIAAFTWGTEQTSTNTSYTRYSENLPAGVKFIGIQHTSNGQYYLYIDNFSVTEYVAPACPVVNAATLAESAVTAHTATVSWTAGGEETAWNLQYKAEGGEWSDVIAISTTPSYDLTGLTENTLYYVRVQADCAGDGTGDWTGDEAFSFPTDCEPQSVSKASPWNYGFEDAVADLMPACWAREEAYANHGYPVVLEYSSYAHSGSKLLYFYTPAHSGTPAYTEDAILPVFNTEIKNLKVSFVYFNYSTATNYGQLAIGYVSGNEFTQVGELLAKVDDYTSIEREMPNDAPDGARIAIRCIGSTKSGYSTYAYVDDIVVSLKPTCYVPTALAAAETSDGAVLTWTAGKDENEWSVRYSVKDADSWTTIDEIAANNYTLTGLSQNVTYEVQVKAVCGVGDESAWSASAEFEPVCNAPSALAVTARTQTSATFSWTSSETAWKLQYKAADAEWEAATEVNVNANPFTLTGLSAGATYDAKIQAACGSEFSNVVEFTTWCDSKLSLPVELTSFSAIPACWEESPAGAIQIAESKLCFVGEGERFLYLPQTDVNLNLLSATFTFSGSLEFGYIDAPNGAFQAFETQPTSKVELDLATIAPEAPKYLAIRYNGASSLSQSAISAVSIRKTPNCLVPTGVDATPSVGGASISWTNGGSEEAWNIQYKLASVASWDGAAQVAASTKPFELSGLEQGVTYKVRVQAACVGEDPSDWSDEASFTTDCAGIAELPWFADFSHDLSNCWTIHSESSSSYYIPAANTSMNQLNMNGGKDGTSNNVLVLPAFSADLFGAVLSLEYKNGATGASYAKLEIGYVTDKNDASTFTIIGEACEQTTSFTEVRVALADVTSGRQIAFRFAGATTQSDMTIKNLRVLEQLTLADNANNSAILASHNGKAADVVIGRTLVAAEYYNTLCLPFNLATLDGTPLEGGDLWAFKYAKVDEATDELLFRIVEASSIEAGKPYFIAFPNNTENIVDPLFKNVTISATVGQKVGNEVAQLCGIVDQPVVFNAGDQTKLFLAANNTLYWWNGNAASQLNNFRAYFKVQTSGVSGGAPARHGMPARLIKQDQEEQIATGINNTNVENVTFKFIENDQVVIIRNGVKYNIQGQVISK